MARKHIRIPGIGNLLGSKNLASDMAILVTGFILIGVASAAGTVLFKYVYNNYLINDIPNAEKVPY